MILKLIESIICNGEHYLPKRTIDTADLGISDAEAEVLVRRGTAELVDEPRPASAPVMEPEQAAPVATKRRKG